MKYLFLIKEFESSLNSKSIHLRICISEGDDIEDAKLNLIKRDRHISLGSLDLAPSVELINDISSIDTTLVLDSSGHLSNDKLLLHYRDI